MKRAEAVTFLKEITSTCRSMSPDSVSLFHPKIGSRDSIAYQVHIKVALDSETKLQIRNIAEKYSLAIKEEEGKVIIYKPKEATKAIQ
jgi:biotin-(acetyl-CoA carboxylase) ligase